MSDRIHPMGIDENIGQRKTESDAANGGFDCCGQILIILSYFLVIITFPVAVFYCVNVISLLDQIDFDKKIFFSGSGRSRIPTSRDFPSRKNPPR